VKNAAIGIIFSDDRTRVLVIQRNDVPIWVLPGGGIDPGETPEKAVIREVLEETGLSVRIRRKVGEYTPINRLASLTHVYECQRIDGTPSTGAETRDIGFYPIQNLPTIFFIVHDDWLHDALRNENEVIKKPIDRVTYLQVIKFFFQHPLLLLRFALSRLGLPINKN
jgi:8-oxo-dGTP pyrophosphatase MutT (NUDIX family)